MNAKALAKSVYGVAEGIVDDSIEDAAVKAADVTADKVLATENNDWDDEGAEKVALFTETYGRRLRERLTDANASSTA